MRSHRETPTCLCAQSRPRRTCRNRQLERFGSAANLSIHLHRLVLEGVYRCGADGLPAFVEASAPTDDELHALLQTPITRLMKMLTRRGVLIEEMGQTYLADPDADGEEARTPRPLQAATVTYRIAFGPRAEQKVLTLRGAMPGETTARQPLCADIDGSVCTRPCGSKRTTAGGSNSCAATSRAPRYRTSGCSSTLPGRWS